MKNLNDLFTLLENKNLLLLEHLSVTLSKYKQQQVEETAFVIFGIFNVVFDFSFVFLDN